MAIIKSIETPLGVIAEYHNLNVYKNTADGYAEITVNGYVNEEKRRTGAKPLTRNSYVLPVESSRGGESLEAMCYAYVMSLKEYEGGISDEA